MISFQFVPGDVWMRDGRGQRIRYLDSCTMGFEKTRCLIMRAAHEGGQQRGATDIRPQNSV